MDEVLEFMRDRAFILIWEQRTASVRHGYIRTTYTAVWRGSLPSIPLPCVDMYYVRIVEVAYVIPVVSHYEPFIENAIEERVSDVEHQYLYLAVSEGS